MSENQAFQTEPVEGVFCKVECVCDPGFYGAEIDCCRDKCPCVLHHSELDLYVKWPTEIS